MSSDAFQLLGLTAKGVTEAAVRKAYAAKLKQVRPDTDPEGFMALRDAYEFARVRARQLEAGRAARQEARRARTAKPKQSENAAPPPLIDLGPDDDALEFMPAPPIAAHADNSAAAAQFSETLPASAEQFVNRQPPAEIAIGQVEALVKEPWRWQSLDAWREIIDQDDLQSIDDFQDFEWRIRQFVCEQTGFGDLETPELRPWMTDDVMELLNERFRWTRGVGRDGWEQMQFRWLYVACESYGWFESGMPASQFSTPAYINAEVHVSRPPWMLHPVVALLAAYITFFVMRYVDRHQIDLAEQIVKLGSWAPATGFLLGVFGMLALVAISLYAASAFLGEFFFLLRRAKRRLFRQRQRGNAGWYTTNDWLALIGAIIAIVVIESQYDPPPRSILSTPGVTVMYVPTN